MTKPKEATVQYLLLIHDVPSRWASLDEGEINATMAEYGTYTDGLRERGLMVAGDALGFDSKLVRVRDSGTQVSDGPYAETREQLGGYYLVECDSIEQAAEAAAGIPSARWGTIEVRPIRST
jgi:hypothetical protein